MLAMALIKHCIRVISWNNRILKSLAAFERTVIKVLALFLQLLMSAEGCVALPFIGALSSATGPCDLVPISGPVSGGNQFCIRMQEGKDVAKLTQRSRITMLVVS